jgi:hypothetical protein
MGLISSRKPSCQPLGFHGQSTALIVVKPQPTFAQLLAQNPVLLAQVIDDLVFPLVHPSGHGDQYEMKRIRSRLAEPESLICHDVPELRCDDAIPSDPHASGALSLH